MAILIKDMKLPDCCAHCAFKYNSSANDLPNGGLKIHLHCKLLPDELSDIYLKRDENCPLQEVPDLNQVVEYTETKLYPKLLEPIRYECIGVVGYRKE